LKKHDPENNEKKPQVNGTDSPDKKAKKPKKGWGFYMLAALLFFFLIVIPVTVNFFADRIFGETARELIRNKTGGKYDFDYGNISFNLFNRKLVIDDFLIHPDSSLIVDSTGKSLMPPGFFNLKMDRFFLKGAHLWRLILKREFLIRELSLQNPRFQMIPGSGDTTTVSGTGGFEFGNLHQLSNGYLSLFEINKFEILDGSIKIEKAASDSAFEMTINNISVRISDFHLDSVVSRNAEAFYFFDSLALMLNNGSIAVNNTNLTFGKINISTAGKSIRLSDIAIKHEPKEKTAAENNRFELALPEISITGADFIGMQSGRLTIGEILIPEPVVFTDLKSKGKGTTNPDEIAGMVFQQVTTLFHPVAINSIILSKADVTIENFQPGHEPLEINDLTLALFRVRFDSSQLASPLPFRFVEDIDLKIGKQTVELKNPDNVLGFDALHLDTRNSTFNVKSFYLSVEEQNGAVKGIDLNIPALTVMGKDFKKDLTDRALHLKQIELTRPFATINYKPSTGDHRKSVKPDNLYPYIKGILKTLAIEKTKITDAGFLLTNAGTFGTQAQVKRFDLNIGDFVLNGDTSQSAEKIFYSSNIGLDLNDLVYYFPDSIHRLSLDHFDFDTKDSLLHLIGIHIDTTSGIHFQGHIKQKHHAKVDIAAVEATHVDFPGLYRQENIDIDKLTVSDPVIRFYHIQPQKDTARGNSSELLKNYHIGNLLIKNLDVTFDRPEHDSTLIKISGADLHVWDIQPSSGAGCQHPGNDSLTLHIAKMLYLLPDGYHIFETDSLYLSDRDSVLRINNLNIYPGEKSLNLGKDRITALFPQIRVSGFDLEKALYHDELTANQITFNNSNLQLIAGKKKSGSFSFKKMIIDPIRRNMLDIAVKWDLSRVIFRKTAFNMFTGHTFDTQIFNADDLTLTLDGFYLDSTVIMTNENVLFARDIRLELNKPLRITDKPGHRITLGNFSLSTLGRHISADKFEVFDFKTFDKMPSQNRRYLYDKQTQLSFNRIDLSGIDFYRLIVRKQLEIDTVRVDAPVYLLKRRFSKAGVSDTAKQDINFYRYISNQLYSARINNLNINNASVAISGLEGENASLMGINRIDVDLSNIFIDSTNQAFGNKFLYADNLNLSVRDYAYKTSNGLYITGASKIVYNGRSKMLLIDSGYLKPLLGRKAFAEKVGVQTDRLDLTFKEAMLENPRLYEAFFKNYFWADQLILTGMDGEDYRDKSYPMPQNHYPDLPVSALKKLNFGLRIDSVDVSNSKFKYYEFVEPAREPGLIWFDNIRVKARHITNDPELISKHPKIGVTVRADLMGAAPIDLSVIFFQSDNDSLHVSSIIRQMDLTEMNPLLENIAFLKVKKGQNKLVKFEFQANNDFARGNLNFIYKNLAIRLIDKKTLRDKGFGESVASFMANAFVVRSSNPKYGLFMREGKIFFLRDKHKSFFNYLAKATLSGVNSTIRGVNEERKEKRIRRRKERKSH
jgi:hypothetical protein